MKQNVGVVGIVIAIVVVLVIAYFGFQAIKGPDKVSPEETRKHMGGGAEAHTGGNTTPGGASHMGGGSR